MKSAFRQIVGSFALFATPGAAMAHVGDHSDQSVRALVNHLLEWDHLAMIAGAVVLAIAAFRKFRCRADKTGVQ